MSLKRSNNKPTAKLSDNKLVLTLPDAMTPVVWMIDTQQSGSFFMRVEKDDNGLHILQKIENSGKNVKIEDIAYYVDKAKAVTAMMTVGHILDKKDTNCRSGSFIGKIMKWFFISLMTAIIVLVAIVVAINVKVRSNTNASAPIEMGQAPVNQNAPFVVDDPDAIGVPMSADSFMEKQESTLRLPF